MSGSTLFEMKEASLTEARELMKSFLTEELNGRPLVDELELPDNPEGFDYIGMLVVTGIALETLVEARLDTLEANDDLKGVVADNLDGTEWLQDRLLETGLFDPGHPDRELDTYFGDKKELGLQEIERLHRAADIGAQFYVEDLLLLGKIHELEAVK